MIRRCMRITWGYFAYCNLRRYKHFQIRLGIATKFRISGLKTITKISYHKRWFFAQQLSLEKWFFSIDCFLLGCFLFRRVFFSIAHFFFSIAHKFFTVRWISTHVSLKVMVFGSFVTAIRRLRSSAMSRNGSRQMDQGKAFEGKPEEKSP